AKALEQNRNTVIIESQADDPLGSNHHEGGTLWMGAAGSSITNTYGRFHHISNAYVAGPALFPASAPPIQPPPRWRLLNLLSPSSCPFARLGSANPTLTALALAKHTAAVIVP